MSKITIHGGMRIAGVNPGMENLEFEELSLDPENPGVGRIWLNTAEQKIKFVTHLDELNRSIIRAVATADDVEALNTLLLTHSLSHTPNGSDAIPTDTAVGLSPSSINKEGVADSLARSDHEHQITGFQPASSELSQIAALQGAGIPKRNAGGSWSLGALISGDIPNLDWSKITTGKPTTLAGYGITDAVPTNVLNILAGNVAVMSGSNTTIPYDNTTPLVTEGALVMQATVNPRGTDSRFAFNFNSMGDASTNGLGIILALFRKIGSGAWNCVGITPFWIGNAVWPSTPSKPITLSMMRVDAPATIEPVSYMLRIGLTSSGSWYLGRGQDATFGGVGYSSYTITEFKQ